MPTEISAADQVREFLWNTVEPFTQQKEGCDKFIHILESKKNEGVPCSKNPAFQDEVNKTHAIYIQRIETSTTNLKAQNGNVERIKELFARPDDEFIELVQSLPLIIHLHESLQAEHKLN
ncbi:MAG TPA: hypothetical protein VFU89_01965, partial [Rhabdochlamydiaceae bacterium]|nr:hypothetical protein [Rhabdochlamydiaceae bacterium]